LHVHRILKRYAQFIQSITYTRQSPPQHQHQHQHPRQHNAMDSAGSKSVMSNDMKELQQGKEATMNQIRGHKANLSNPSEFNI
jgi:hypothetical protein